MRRGALFDVDGLLVDSETLGIRVFRGVLADKGINLSPEEAERYFVGRKDKDSYELVCAERELGLNVEDLLRTHFSVYERDLANVPAIPGAEGVVRRCFQLGYTIAAVSGSTLYQVGIILDGLNVKNLFSEIIGCDSLINGNPIKGKPAPQGYLETARRMSIPIENCLVFEDSSLGIVAGKNAGAYVIGVQGNSNQDISQADYKVHSLKEIGDAFLVEFRK